MELVGLSGGLHFAVECFCARPKEMPLSDSGGLSLHLTRVLPAPVPLVFNAHADPVELAKWWGPKGFSSPSIEINLCVGGGYRIAMQPPDSELFYLSGEFLDVAPPTHLAYTFRWEDPTPDDRETIVTLSLRDLSGSTELTIDQGVFATEERRALHEQGWTESLDRLQELISSRIQQSDPSGAGSQSGNAP